jgi:site-specific recombinase XerD
LIPTESLNFSSRRFGPFTTRRIQQIVQGYRETAWHYAAALHPHLFRHQMLTYLTSKGLSDAQIQLLSGHESKKSSEVYQHLSLESVDKALPGCGSDCRDLMRATLSPTNSCGTLRTFVGI